jgi:hypothetical protein
MISVSASLGRLSRARARALHELQGQVSHFPPNCRENSDMKDDTHKVRANL